MKKQSRNLLQHMADFEKHDSSFDAPTATSMQSALQRDSTPYHVSNMIHSEQTMRTVRPLLALAERSLAW